MPSPFPGIDPFLESQGWDDFHTRLITAISDCLAPQLRPRYVPRIEQRIYVERPFESGRAVRADVAITTAPRAPTSSFGPGAMASAAVLEPAIVELAVSEERKESFLSIRHAKGAQIVTVVEVLSPSNKRAGGDGRTEYLTKRDDLLHSKTNLVEIDLLRGGLRMPTSTMLPAGDYFTIVRRGERSLQAEVFHWWLADCPPPIPLPLEVGVPDATIDLGMILAEIYDRASYALALDYDLAVEPPLSSEQARWAEEILAGRPPVPTALA